MPIKQKMDKEATWYSTKHLTSFSSHVVEGGLYFSSLVNHPGLAVSRFALWQNTQIPNSVLKISISQTSIAEKSSLKVVLHKIITQSNTLNIAKHTECDSKVLKLWAKLTDMQSIWWFLNRNKINRKDGKK